MHKKKSEQFVINNYSLYFEVPTITILCICTTVTYRITEYRHASISDLLFQALKKNHNYSPYSSCSVFQVFEEGKIALFQEQVQI